MHDYTGGCLCGAVRIEIAAAPYRVGICHCLDCRKRQGAIFHTFAVFPVDAVTVTGETHEFEPILLSDLRLVAVRPLGRRVRAARRLPRRAQPADAHVREFGNPREAWLPPFDVANRYERDRTSERRSDP